VGEFIKPKKASFKIVAVEPADSPVLSGGKPGPQKIQGIGAGFIPQILDTKLIDEIMTATTDESVQVARRMAKEEGLLVGISSGAAIVGALAVAKQLEQSGWIRNHGEAVIVTILCDSADKYLSERLWEE